MGWIRFPHDDEGHRTNVPQFFLALASLAFTIYMVPGLWGAPCKAISAFTPPMNTQDFNLYQGTVDTYDMKWTSQCTEEVTRLFADLDKHFISKGYPVILGEYGSNGVNEKTINKNCTDEQKSEASRCSHVKTSLTSLN